MTDLRQYLDPAFLDRVATCGYRLDVWLRDWPRKELGDIPLSLDG